MREIIEKRVRWHIYIVSLNSEKKRHYNNTHEYYTGITHSGIGHRMGDYLFDRGKGYVNTVWRDAIKKLVYVE